MGVPRIDDDGKTVTVDLHGLGVHEAVRWTERVLREAHRRGRSSARIIHGSSTSSTLFPNRTIKHALYDWMDSPIGRTVTSAAWKHDSFCIVGVRASGNTDRRPIRVTDWGITG